jgi:hypothetical protein
MLNQDLIPGEKLMEQYIKDFKMHNEVSNEIIERYKESVPNEIIALWRKYGFGSFMQ